MAGDADTLRRWRSVEAPYIGVAWGEPDGLDEYGWGAGEGDERGEGEVEVELSKGLMGLVGGWRERGERGRERCG